MTNEKPEVKPMSRSEREAKLKDKAGWVIALFAAVLAISTLIGGQNSSKILNNTIASNNTWSWYQAKNVRQVLYETAAIQSTGANKEKFIKESLRMEQDKKDLAEKAKSMESEREKARQKSPWFTYGGSTMQIAIVLLTASILVVSTGMFYAGIGVGLIGTLLVSQALWLWIPFLK